MKKTILLLFITTLCGLLGKYSLTTVALAESQYTSHSNVITLKSSENIPTLIELYTSQGCSSCPPADRYLNTLKNDSGLFKEFIPMAFHVDYWDYLGWKDPFASSQHSKRQRMYRAANKSNSVYTPQFIVNDQEWRGFFKQQAIATHSGKPASSRLTVELNDNIITADYSAKKGHFFLHTALLGIGIKTSIPIGENAGSTLKQDFIVLAHQRSSSHSNHWKITLPTSSVLADELAFVAWVTKENDSQALQAVATFLPETYLGQL